jgi:tetratricopeptide (TPR) repeat protein
MVPKYRFRWMYSNICAADALRRLGRLDEARSICQTAIAEIEELVRDQYAITENRSMLAWALRVLGQTRLADADAAGASSAFRRALSLNDGLPARSGEIWFETACCHSAISTLAGRAGSGIPTANKAAEADQALALLRKAVDLGYRAETFRTEPALDPLREREDFKKLMSEIEALNKAEAANDKDAGTK